MPEGITKKNSSLFRRISDFAVPRTKLVLGYQEFDDTPDLAYIYDKDGGFVETRSGVPRDDSAGHFNHTMFAKVGADIFGVDGGQSDFNVYKNGVGWIPGGGSANYITSNGNTLWVLITNISLFGIDATTGGAVDTQILPYSAIRHRTNGDKHIVTYHQAGATDPDWEYRHVLLNSSFGGDIILQEHTHISGTRFIEYLDVAINSDRVAVCVTDYHVPTTTTIKIYNHTGGLEDTIVHVAQVEMLLMSEDRLYASDAVSGVVTMWDIIDDGIGNKTYTPAGGFNTSSPHVWYGNLSS